MPLQDVFQLCLIEVGLLEQLLDARFVLGPAHAGGYGHNVFGAEYFCRHAFVINMLSLAHGFLGQSLGGEELDGKSTNEEMFAFDLPTLCLQMRVDGRNARSQSFVGGDEENVRIVGGERFDVINRRERAAERPVFNQLRGNQFVRRTQQVGQGQIIGRLIGCHDRRISDSRLRVKLREFKAHDNESLALAFTPDGRRLVSVAFNRSPKIWDVASGKMIGQPIEADQPHCFVRISPDGKRLATRSRGGVVRLWDAMTGLPMSKPFEHEGPVIDLAFTPDGLTLVTGSQDGTARALSFQHGQARSLSLKTEDALGSACFTRDGRQVILTSDEKILRFDATTGAQVATPMIHAKAISRMKVSPDGQKLITRAWNGTARVWDLRTEEPNTTLLVHTMRIFGVGFSPDSRLAVTASEDGTARLWDAETGEPRCPTLRHDAEILHVAFSPDSCLLLTAGVDGTARLWSTEDGHPVWPEPLHHKGILWSAEFDPAGSRIVTASVDKSARVWSVESRRPLTPPIRHTRGVNGASFSPDGRWVLTWSEDGVARVWDSRNGEPISQPMRHNDSVNVAVFNPDGTRVLTGSRDGVVRLWDAASGYPLSELMQNAGPISAVEFTPDGQFFLNLAAKDALRIGHVVTPPIPVPPWFCDLVQAVSGRHLTTNREIEPVGSDVLRSFRQRFENPRESDFYSRWARWFLRDRMKDPAPEFVP